MNERQKKGAKAVIFFLAGCVCVGWGGGGGGGGGRGGGGSETTLILHKITIFCNIDLINALIQMLLKYSLQSPTKNSKFILAVDKYILTINHES